MKWVFALLFLQVSTLSQGCDCISIIGTKEANWVFEGDVICIKDVSGKYEVEFKVTKVIKGYIKSNTVKYMLRVLVKDAADLILILSSGMRYIHTWTED